MSLGRIVTSAENQLLDTMQLEQLENCFRSWKQKGGPGKQRASRSRIFLVFLLIRYTGAKLSEVLALDPREDIDLSQRTITFRGPDASDRKVEISEAMATEVKALLAQHDAKGYFAIDPAYVRRKFYERSQECGFDKKKAGPEMLRKARAFELMQNDMPLPAVQRLLGHSSPNLTTSFLSFSDEDMREVTRRYMERESGRKTSARNSFFSKVTALAKGGVQTLVEMITFDGQPLYTIITNTSVDRLGLKPGRLVTAEIKSPWLMLERVDRPGKSSAENAREGAIIKVESDPVNTECTVCLPDGAELCSVLSTRGFELLGLEAGDPARVVFSAYAVILHAD